MDDNTQYVNNHPTEIPEADNEGVDNDNDEKRRYMNMNLRDVSRINYKFIHDGKEIPINDEEEMIFPHINDNNDIEDDDDTIPQVGGLAGVYNSNDDKDEYYNTESDSDNESDDEDTNDAHDDESTGSEIPGVEIPGVDNNTK